MTHSFWNTDKEIELFAECEKYCDQDDDPFFARDEWVMIDTVKSKGQAVSKISNSIVEQLEVQLPKAPFINMSLAIAKEEKSSSASDCFSENLFEDCLFFQNNSWGFDSEHDLDNGKLDLNFWILRLHKTPICSQY